MRFLISLLLLSCSAFSATLTSITLTPGNLVLYPTETQQYTATCRYSDHADDDCTLAGGALSWVVTNPNGLATITSGGLLTAHTHTTSDIRGYAGACLSYVELRVAGSAIYGYSYLAVTAGAETITSLSTLGLLDTVPVGVTLWASAKVTTSAGWFSASRTVTWTSSAPSIATVDWEGHITAVAPGAVTFTATAHGVTKTISLTVVAVTTNPSPKTWYVRPLGGTRYDATLNATGQCDGWHDADYPGSGVNQPCAYSSPKWLWYPGPVVTAAQLRWAIAGGDTVIIRQNPNGVGNVPSGVCNNGSYDCGYDVGQKDEAHFTGPASYDTCAGLQYGCTNIPIPSGAPSQHTRILGENYTSCASISAKTTLYGTVITNPVFNLSNTSYVDVACIGVSDRFGCRRYATPDKQNPGQLYCPSLDLDRPGTGILVDPATTNVTLTDVDVHGTSNGWLGMSGDNIAVTRVRFAGNDTAGMNFDPGPGYPQGGGVTADYLTVEWSGCAEQYPVVDPLPYDNCQAQNTSPDSGYGDAIGTPDTGGTWIFDHSLFRYNTQDGIDLTHVSLSGPSPFSITNSIAYANMGQQFKLGLTDTVIFRSNQTIGDCFRMAFPIVGAPATYNNQLGLPILSGTWAAGTATVTLADTHQPWAKNRPIPTVGSGANYIRGAQPAGYNISGVVVTGATDTTLSYAVASDPGPYVGGGVVTGPDTCRANAAATALNPTAHTTFYMQNNTWTVPSNIAIQLECAYNEVTADCTGAKINFQNNIIRGYVLYPGGAKTNGIYMGNGSEMGPIFTGVRDHNTFYTLKPGLETDCNKGYTGEICVDPMFVGGLSNATWEASFDSSLFDTADLRLLAGSPAIDTGVTIAAVPKDYRGISRPQGTAYDMGAFEFVLGGGNLPEISTVALPGGIVGTAYSTTLAATGDTPITWSVLSGALPTGLALGSSTGTISGTPVLASTVSSVIRATNAIGTADAPFTITIAPVYVPPPPYQSGASGSVISGTIR